MFLRNQKKGPVNIVISITNRCNLRCRMCQIPLDKKEELPVLDWEKFIAQASAKGAKICVFSGGEPLLRDDIYRLIRFAKNQGMLAAVCSNGTLINKSVSTSLYRAGTDILNISLDGRQKTHDYLRGRGVFEKAVSALENAKKSGITTVIAATVLSFNYRELPFIVDLAYEKGVSSITFQPFNSIFIAKKQDWDYFILPAGKRNDLSKILDKVRTKCRSYRINTNPVGYLKRIPFYLSGENTGIRNRCSGLEQVCALDCRGNIYPCWNFSRPRYIIGNISQTPFPRIWDSERRRRLCKYIRGKKCRGCLMSCYDNIFEPGFIIKTLRKLKRMTRFD